MLDKYFAIQRVGDNKYEMGTKAVAIDENSDIIVDGVKYDGTTGLWALIMMNDPSESSYTPNDLRMYKDLVYRTNVMSHPHNVVLGRSRYNKTKNGRMYFLFSRPYPLMTMVLVITTSTTMTTTTTTTRLFTIRSSPRAGRTRMMSLIKMAMEFNSPPAI